MKLERDKFYRTRDGRKARVIATDLKSDYSCVAVVESNEWDDRPNSYLSNGRTNPDREANRDLISEWPTEPLRVEFECEWRKNIEGVIFPYGDGSGNVTSVLVKIVGKKTRVTIEEVSSLEELIAKNMGYDHTKYRPGLLREPNTNRVSHLYQIGENLMDFLNPMCRRGWNRDDGETYSIWRGHIGDKGICKTCAKRAALCLSGLDTINLKIEIT